MTFVEAFYSFNLDINDTNNGRYGKLRVKAAKHPNESLEHLVARVIALCSSHEEGLNFSEGLFQPKDPTIIKTSSIGELERWIEVGCPEREKIDRALRRNPDAEFRIYFYSAEQISAFCEYLRGSKTNWASRIKFFSLSPEALEALGANLSSSSRWTVTFADDHFYVASGGGDAEGRMTEIDIWSIFQETIGNAA